MTTFAARVIECLGIQAKTQADLARAAGVSGASISDWVNEITQPDNLKAAPLLRAAAFLQVNPMWLLTGKGHRSPTAATVLSIQQPTAAYATWPFEVLDLGLVSSLDRSDRMRLEGAWILTAKQLGFSLAKPDAA